MVCMTETQPGGDVQFDVRSQVLLLLIQVRNMLIMSSRCDEQGVARTCRIHCWV